MAKCIYDERIVLRRGKQKALINLVKQTTGMTWSDLSSKLNISEFTLTIALRNERTTIAKTLLDKLLTMQTKIKPLDIEKEIIECRPAHWGQSLGGKVSIQKIRKKQEIRIPSITNEKFAEFIGILLGDGYLSKKGVDISLDATADQKYCGHIIRLLIYLFGVRPKTYTNRNCVHIRLNSILISNFLVSIGLKCGDKIVNQVTIPDFIRRDNRLLSACIRGLVDTDGCVFLKQKGYNRAAIEITNFNNRLLSDATIGLSKLGYTVSSGGSYGRSVRIQTQSDVIKYVKEIGFSNPKNTERINAFMMRR